MAERKLGNQLAPWRHLAEALQIVETSGATTILMGALPLAGLLLADGQRCSLAAEVHALIRQYWGPRLPHLTDLPVTELVADLS